MSAQIIRFPKAKKRRAKGRRGPCADLIKLPTAPEDVSPKDDRVAVMFNELLHALKVLRDVP